jgi:hypothetical protein
MLKKQKNMWQNAVA